MNNNTFFSNKEETPKHPLINNSDLKNTFEQSRQSFRKNIMCFIEKVDKSENSNTVINNITEEIEKAYGILNSANFYDFNDIREKNLELLKIKNKINNAELKIKNAVEMFKLELDYIMSICKLMSNHKYFEDKRTETTYILYDENKLLNKAICLHRTIYNYIICINYICEKFDKLIDSITYKKQNSQIKQPNINENFKENYNE